MRRILILGGYGTTGTMLTRLLLEYTDVLVTIAGRNLKAAEALRADLVRLFPASRVAVLEVDVEDSQRVRAALKGIDLVLLATSHAAHSAVVANAALECNVDYLDLLYGPKKLKTLSAMAGEIERRGLCFITEAGFHPGLPLALARYLAAQFITLEEVHFGCAIRMRVDAQMKMPDSIFEVVSAFSQKPLVYRNGRWLMPWLAWFWPYQRLAFAPPLGVLNCVPLFLPELERIPVECPGVKATAFYIAGFNWFVDWVISPVIVISVLLAPKASVKPMGKLLFWGLKHFARPPYTTQLVTSARGLRGDRLESMQLTLLHEDGYFLTAAPVVALVKQYLDGVIRKAGLWMMGQIADPAALVQQVREMGVQMETQRTF